jgi:uncharacterized protein (DUF169 family)
MMTSKDFAVLDKFGFEVPPVAVKFLPKRSERIARLDEKMTFCQMLKKAQDGNAFYADDENHSCDAGLYVLGRDVPEFFINGEFGAGLRIYEEPRAASRLYLHVSRIRKGVVNYVAFAPLDNVSFTPDLLIILAKVEQTEILLRAMSYKTCEVWHSRTTSAIGCSWIYIYPYLSGKLNYINTGLGHGMKRRKIFPENRQIISIPYDLLPSILQTLEEMPWVLPAYKEDGMEFVQRLLVQIGTNPSSSQDPR